MYGNEVIGTVLIFDAADQVMKLRFRPFDLIRAKIASSFPMLI